MQKNIFLLVDQLVALSGSASNFDTLDSELTLIEGEIPKLQDEIKELELSMTDEKYFDASQEIVDRNIELSVSKKLKKLEKEYDILKQDLTSIETKEKEYIEAIELLNQKINKSKNNISTIETRLQKTNDELTRNIYGNIQIEEAEKIEQLQQKLARKKESYESISKDVKKLEEKVELLKKEIEISTSRLMEARKNLSSKNNYIDSSLKNEDEESIKDLQKRLLDLEAKKLTILTNATFIASEIKELFISEQNEKAMKKLMELVTIVNARPYMEISDIGSLQNELEKLESAQNNLINLIENKEYYGDDVLYIDHRINHLQKLISFKNNEIMVIKDKISNIDNNFVLEVTKALKMAENQAEELENSISDYDKMIKSSDKKSSNVLVALQASYNKKTNELKVIRDIIERYTKELGVLVQTSAKLEEEKIQKLNEEIIEYQDEIEELSKIKLMSTKTKDAIAQENDKLKLKEISDNIAVLKQRINIGKTPQEIYDEIEMNWMPSFNDIQKNEVIAMGEDTNLKVNAVEMPIENNILVEEKIVSDEQSNLVEQEEEKNDVSVNEVKEEPILDELYNLLNEKMIESSIEETLSTIETKPEENLNELEYIVPKDNYELKEENENVPYENIMENDIKQDVNSDISNDEEEFTFSELDDTDYFSLDDFLKNLEQK